MQATKTTTKVYYPREHQHTSNSWEPLPGYRNWFRGKCEVCGSMAQAYKDELSDQTTN